MTSEQFNEKWKDRLEDGHYGMSIEIPEVVRYMDREFTAEAVSNPTFTYSQIKIKYREARVYATSGMTSTWEKGIDLLVRRLEY